MYRIQARGVRENYREAMYIGLAMGFAVCIMTVWVLAGLMTEKRLELGVVQFLLKIFVAYILISNSLPRYSDVCVACGLVSTAGIVFVVMFMPKGRQLSAMGREGLYAEDRTGLATNLIFSVSFL